MRKTFVLRSMPLVAWVFIALAGMVTIQGLLEAYLMEPREEAVNTLDEAISRELTQAAATVRQRPATVVQLEAIHSSLPRQDSVQTRIEELHQLAKQHGVVLRRVSYKDHLVDASLSSQIALRGLQAELIGGYPQVRLFLRSVLQNDKALSVEKLEFNQSADSKGVRASVQLGMYFHRAPS